MPYGVRHCEHMRKPKFLEAALPDSIGQSHASESRVTSRKQSGSLGRKVHTPLEDFRWGLL